MAKFGIGVRGGSAKVGGLSTSAIRTTIEVTTGTDGAADGGSFVGGGSPGATGTDTGGDTIIDSSPVAAGIAEAATSAASAAGIETATKVIPKVLFDFPLLDLPAPEQFSPDTLDVSETTIENDQFVPTEKEGISSFRPEILTITDFEPIWKDNPKAREFSDAGQLIDANYNALWLRRSTLTKLLTNIQNETDTNTSAQFQALRDRYLSELDRTKLTISYYKEFINQIEAIKSRLNLREIPAGAFGNGRLTLEDFFDRRMNIGKGQYQIYSNTKVLQQFLFDFKQVMENYSYGLLDLSDIDRSGDDSPVKIDKTYNLADGFTFSISQIQSPSTPQNATQKNFFNNFLNSLPDNPDDRIKLMVTILSKEYRVSRGLGITENQRVLQDTFGSDPTGSPFDNMVGIVGDTIFDPPLGNESIASLTSLPLGENARVLPFEKKYVDSKDSKRTFIPGSTFFVDNILETTNDTFNTEPLISYADQLSDKITKSKKLVNSLFQLPEDQRTVLAPDVMNDSILAAIQESISGLTNKVASEFFAVNKDQAVTAALFRLANKDNQLKALLFQYLLLVGSANNTSEDEKPIYTFLASELRSVSSMPDTKTKDTDPDLNEGVANLRPIIERLAEDIEQRVFTIVNPSFDTRLILASEGAETEAPTEDEVLVELSSGDIKSSLMLNVGSATSAASNLMRQFASLANTFSQAAQVDGETRYLVDDGSLRTRLNFLSTSTQLLLLFEALSNYMDKYIFVDFEAAETLSNIKIRANVAKNQFISKTIKGILTESRFDLILSTIGGEALSLIGTDSDDSPAVSFSKVFTASDPGLTTTDGTSGTEADEGATGGILSTLDTEGEDIIGDKLDSPFFGKGLIGTLGRVPVDLFDFQRGVQSLKTDLKSVRSKLDAEQQYKQDALNILDTIEARLRDASTRTSSTFSPGRLESFLENNDRSLLKVIRNPAQVRTSAYLFREFRGRTRHLTGTEGQDAFNTLVDDEVVKPDNINALYSLMSESEFLKDNQARTRMKLVSVGVPAGFSRQLSDRIRRGTIDESSFQAKQFDVIAINIYKRDARYDDLVFKPQRFLFDLSLFAPLDWDNVKPRPFESFGRLLQRFEASDFRNPAIPTPRGLESIVEDPQYDFLTRTQKRQLISNHARDNLYELYIRLLTELRINEEAFPVEHVEPGTDFPSGFASTVLSYLRENRGKDIPDQPISELINNPDLDDDAKDILRLLTFGTTIFEPAIVRNKVVQRKLFDRVFHVAFNTDDFELDEDLTNSTESGKLALKQAKIQENLVRRDGKIYLEPRTEDDLAFEDYFVTIENNI